LYISLPPAEKHYIEGKLRVNRCKNNQKVTSRIGKNAKPRKITVYPHFLPAETGNADFSCIYAVFSFSGEGKYRFFSI
jgi:hypothetical protein